MFVPGDHSRSFGRTRTRPSAMKAPIKRLRPGPGEAQAHPGKKKPKRRPPPAERQDEFFSCRTRGNLRTTSGRPNAGSPKSCQAPEITPPCTPHSDNPRPCPVLISKTSSLRTARRRASGENTRRSFGCSGGRQIRKRFGTGRKFFGGNCCVAFGIPAHKHWAPLWNSRASPATRGASASQSAFSRARAYSA
jgi:hypothetical protein